jgi:uncharacterized membrane protein (UPF0127 family)
VRPERPGANLRNATRGITLAASLELATSPWRRFRGLMLRGRLPAGGGLVIRPCSSIHMMFMRFPIDAVFYGRDLVVTRVGRNVRPWIGFSRGGKGAVAVVELPAGAAQGTEPGDQLEFVASQETRREEKRNNARRRQVWPVAEEPPPLPPHQVEEAHHSGGHDANERRTHDRRPAQD